MKVKMQNGFADGFLDGYLERRGTPQWARCTSLENQNRAVQENPAAGLSRYITDPSEQTRRVSSQSAGGSLTHSVPPRPTAKISTCCAPAQHDGHNSSPRDRTPRRQNTVQPDPGRHTITQAHIPTQRFSMGDSHQDGFPADGEQPVHTVSLSGFSIDTTAVTVEDFRRFAEATGYQTEAEQFGLSAVFYLAVEAPRAALMGSPPGMPWWIAVKGADWAHPGGPDSSTRGRENHPVVHISWHDAQQYCRWSGRALPSEAQWEAASRGGTGSSRFPWGNSLTTSRLNIWQGPFPRPAPTIDFLTTAPAMAYSPNDYGLWQTVGNVWEWCQDWFDTQYYQVSPFRDPLGPPHGTARVMRGGSYLCHDSYCNRYRNSARSSNTPDSSTGNLGFRTVSPS